MGSNTEVQTLLWTFITMTWIYYSVFGNYGHFLTMAIMAILAKMISGQYYWCLQRRLDLRSQASEADSLANEFVGKKLKILAEIVFLYTF